MNLEVWAEVSAWFTAAPTSHSLWFALVGITVAYWVTDIQQLFGWIDAVSETQSFALRPEYLMNAVAIAAKVDVALLAVVIYLLWPGQSVRCI
ncbi:hypothetical protein AWB69_07128 [Caballeronia udeis]|uniref:Uncharacterized protein n=1 Tax=Caballeronia udeis TaxID=1232866 RepID=A0A158J3S3_9BURK|nr:hypothetical protein AWB69_07128 [Caballeronia udeis]